MGAPRVCPGVSAGDSTVTNCSPPSDAIAGPAGDMSAEAAAVPGEATIVAPCPDAVVVDSDVSRASAPTHSPSGSAPDASFCLSSDPPSLSQSCPAKATASQYVPVAPTCSFGVLSNGGGCADTLLNCPTSNSPL
eukprot:GHVT01017475.1.p1 GENE.GHVT01017475.1~~GHVT01017475.1.p1  ORF type:complete len:135 (+),score=13.72 GHVT01017475.1:90-494(+)